MSAKGKRLRTEHLEVRAVASPSPHPRVGFIVPRYKHTAVARNRLKRRLREIVRLRLLHRLPPVDVVVRVRAGAYGATFDQLRSELATLEGALGRMISST